MKKSPVHCTKYEINDCNSDYNLHAEFSLFLDEAKRSERDSQREECLAPKRSQEQEKKKKKSWKVLVFPWLKKAAEHETGLRLSSRCGPHKRSGPVCVRAATGLNTPRRALSGPIMTSLFSPMKKADNETPYMCLDRLGRRCGAEKNYGPVYFVT